MDLDLAQVNFFVFSFSIETGVKIINDQALALVKKLNVTPEANPTSKALTQSAEAERKKLSGLDGAAFDKAYVDN